MGLIRYSWGHISGPHEPIHVKFGVWGFSSCSTEIWSWKCWNAKMTIWWRHTSVLYASLDSKLILSYDHFFLCFISAAQNVPNLCNRKFNFNGLFIKMKPLLYFITYRPITRKLKFDVGWQTTYFASVHHNCIYPFLKWATLV